MNSQQRGFNPILPPQPASMEALILRFLVCFAMALSLRRRYPEAFFSPPESAQSSIPLGSLRGQKARQAWMKQRERMLEEKPFPVGMLSCAMKRRISELCRLEIERDNLKKDADIYNSLQERLQESAPYKLIMDLSAMELEAPEMSFEELLAREKEDTAFLQRNGKMRSISSK